jgi:hypothetical protein
MQRRSPDLFCHRRMLLMRRRLNYCITTGAAFRSSASIQNFSVMVGGEKFL